MNHSPKFRAKVITVSTRAAAGTYSDLSGPLIVKALTELGIKCDQPLVMADGPLIESELRKAVDENFDLIITTGGTGHAPTDVTPQLTKKVIDRESPGICEAIRAFGLAKQVFTSALSRAIAGVSGNSLIINLPGSPAGVKDALIVLDGFLLHALEQLSGEDHRPAS
jgi:molybdenum cofactor synthesis domain-containing protein